MQMFNDLYERSVTQLKKEIKELEETCNKHKDIDEFVTALLYPARHTEEEFNPNKSMEYLVGLQLSSFICQLIGYDITYATTSPHYFECDLAQKLNNFIGAYFLDDLCFLAVRNRDMYNEWMFKTDNIGGFQNPAIMIAAAKDNAVFYANIRGMNGLGLRSIAHRGMVSSDSVETLQTRK